MDSLNNIRELVMATFCLHIFVSVFRTSGMIHCSVLLCLEEDNISFK